MTSEKQGQPLIVKFQGRYYDLQKFASKHPGGAHLLEKAASNDVETYLTGKEDIDGSQHEHSANAYRILQKYALDGPKATEDDDIDYEKPIVWQVGKLGHQYWEWIHRPVDKELRMFHTDFIEYFSRTHWATIPCVWLPIVALFTFLGSQALTVEKWEGRSHTLAVTGLFLFGCVWWTQLEYLLHRFAFHWHPNPDSPTQITLHFFLHGLHHKTPMDRGRLVFPPPVGAIFVFIVFYLHSCILPSAMSSVVSAGTLFGYICYDLIHYYLHHGTPAPGSHLHTVKHYHHNHHFKNPDLSYGITSKLWDIPFGTLGAA